MVCSLNKFITSGCFADKMKQIRSLVFQKRYFQIKIVHCIRYVDQKSLSLLWRGSEYVSLLGMHFKNKIPSVVLNSEQINGIFQTWDKLSKQCWSWSFFTARRQKGISVFHPPSSTTSTLPGPIKAIAVMTSSCYFWSILFHFLCGPSQQEECPISFPSGGVKVRGGQLFHCLQQNKLHIAFSCKWL